MFNFGCTILLLALTLAFTAVSKSSADPSNKIGTFMSLTTGKWTNYKQYNRDLIYNRLVHDNFAEYFIPFDNPLVDYPHTFLYWETLNYATVRIHVVTVTEDQDGNLRMRPLNITSAGMEKLRFDLSDPPRVIDFEPEDLVESPKECDIVFVQIETNVFFGQWPNCRDTSLGEILHYDVVMSCNMISGFAPSGSLEDPNPLPYTVRRDTSYPPLPQLLEGFDNFNVPCTCI